jgi:uridine phosphorylase
MQPSTTTAATTSTEQPKRDAAHENPTAVGSTNGSAAVNGATTANGLLLSTVHNDRVVKCELCDYYYHLGLDSSLPLTQLFGNVRFVLMSGSAVRAQDMTMKLTTLLQLPLPFGTTLSPIGKTERYTLYKLGPVLSVSHGMGMPSASILLHEITKLLFHAGVKHPTYIRIGTSGGINVEPGTVVISNGVLNGFLQPYHDVVIHGKVVHRSTAIDTTLADEILSCANVSPAISATTGKTLATDDFYEGQSRLDGAICEYTEQEKLDFLKNLQQAGVRNIEMESGVVASFCHKLNIRCAILCVTLLNRLLGDQIALTPQQVHEYTDRPLMIVARFLQKQLGLVKSPSATTTITTAVAPASAAAAAVATTTATTVTTVPVEHRSYKGRASLTSLTDD